MSSHSTRDWSLMLALFSASLALRVAIIDAYQFDGLYGQDAYAYYDGAASILAALRTGAPILPLYWPVGYPLLLAGAFALFGVSAATAQAVTLLLSALLPVAVYALAREMGARTAGAFAAALVVAVGGQVIQSGIVVMADIPALLWATFSSAALWRYVRRGGARWLALAVGLLVLAAITRWAYALLAVSWLAAILIGRGRIPGRHGALALGAGLLALLPQIVYLAVNPVSLSEQGFVRGWSLAHMFQRAFSTGEGRLSYEQVNALFYARPLYDATYLAPVFGLLVLVGLVVLLRRWRDGRAILLGGWLLLPYLFLAGIPHQSLRYPLVMVPALAVLCGLGMDRLLVRLPRARLAAAIALMVGGAGWMLAASAPVLQDFLRAQQRDQEIAVWAAEQLPPGAAVYANGLTLRLAHTATVETRELFYETLETLAAAWVAGREDYLLVNLWEMENIWKGQPMYAAFDWLREARGLISLGREGNYTLFRVRG